MTTSSHSQQATEDPGTTCTAPYINVKQLYAILCDTDEVTANYHNE